MNVARCLVGWKLCVAFSLVLLVSCTTAIKLSNESKYISDLYTIDENAVVLSTNVDEEEKLYTDGRSLFALRYSGMQKRPVLRNINNGKTHKGVDADKTLRGLELVTPAKLGALKLSSGCLSSQKACYFDIERSTLYLFSDNGDLLETITLSDSASFSGTSMRTLLGDKIFRVEYNKKLKRAVDANDSSLEEMLITSLGSDVDWRALFQHSKASRHKNKYVESLRNENTYTSLISAYDLSGDVQDLDGAFTLRSSNIINFVERIDIIANSSSEKNMTDVIQNYNQAPDIVAFRLQRVKDNERKERENQARLAEKEKRDEIARIARIEEQKKSAERQRLAKERAAALLAKRKNNIGNPVSWKQSKKIDTDDCAGLFGIPVVCLWVTYDFTFEGEITGVNAEKKSYVARVDRQELLVPSFVSAKYIQMKNKGLNWAEGQIGGTYFIPFSEVDTY